MDADGCWCSSITLRLVVSEAAGCTIVGGVDVGCGTSGTWRTPLVGRVDSNRHIESKLVLKLSDSLPKLLVHCSQLSTGGLEHLVTDESLFAAASADQVDRQWHCQHS